MADQLEDLLRACTVRVIGGPMPGAGFFVAPTMVLTSVHVIGDSDALIVRWERDREPVLEVPVSGRVAVLADRGRPIPALDRDYPDIAVLEVGGLDDHPCVSIDQEWPSQEDSFQVFGYPEEGGAVQLTPARLTYRGTHGTAPTAYLDLASDTIKPGMSGAAVLNLRSGKVCGVVVASKEPSHPDGALAIPWSAISVELSEVLAANRAFHARDQRWQAAAASRREHLRFRLPRVVAHFIGRDDMLARLDVALSERRAGVITQAISGLGGVGKTQLAAAYVAAHRDEFEIVAWVRAEDGGTADLAELAVALALPVTGRTPSERASDALMFLSNTDRRWLLVFDNAPGPEALRGLPSSGHGRILVTSRHRGGYETFGQELPIDVFDADTARRYLLARTGRASREADQADAVANALGRLPLALAHASAYCASDTGVPFSGYLELLENLPSQDLFDTNPDVFYQHTVAATWSTSIAAAEQQAPLARLALQMTTCLAPDGIPRSFFSVLEENSATGRKRMADALASLNRHSLVTLADNQVSVHRLLQKVIRDQLAEHEQTEVAVHALTAIQRAMPPDPQLSATWPQWQELLPHVTEIAGIQAAASHHAAQLMGILNPTCQFLLYSHSSRPALALATRAVTISTERLGDLHPDTLTALLNLSGSYHWRGNVFACISICERVAAVRERILGPDHRDTLTALAELAIVRWSAGDLDQAIAIEERVAAARERILGPDHRDTLTALCNLAVSYKWAGRADEALTILEQVAAKFERVLGPDHLDTLHARTSLGIVYQEAGRIGESITILEQVIAGYERLLGPKHPVSDVARANLRKAKTGDFGQFPYSG